jgi:hypothetical protein
LFSLMMRRAQQTKKVSSLPLLFLLLLSNMNVWWTSNWLT